MADHHPKSYPLLTAIKLIFLGIGLLMILSGCLFSGISLTVPDAPFSSINSLLDLNTDIYRVMLSGLFAMWALVGVGLIATSEIIAVLLDIAADNSRQAQYLWQLLMSRN